MDVFVSGSCRSAIFMSPNTDRLSVEHAETCAKFDVALVPSAWCRATVAASVPGADIISLPLGVSEGFAEGQGREESSIGRLMRIGDGSSCAILHFSTDQVWPGRKGTEELLKAWALLKGSGRLGTARLIIHIPRALQVPCMLTCRDLDIYDSVTIVAPELRGSEEVPLWDLVDRADLMVAPSRCEGFGMMLLSSLVAGLPLLSTYNTGHADFLCDSPGWLGVPTAALDEMYGEEGLAPVVDPPVLAQALATALQPEVRRMLVGQHMGEKDASWGTWGAAEAHWDRALKDWIEEK
jgi:glycosyltransferase involved in cell wall biosynthesis